VWVRTPVSGLKSLRQAQETVAIMRIEEIARVLDATIHYLPPGFDKDFKFAGASDLMSDVLADVSLDIVLLTGLMNIQVIRTMMLMEISSVVFTRGKPPTEEILETARSANIAVISTGLKLFTASGILYASGMRNFDDEKKRVHRDGRQYEEAR
jgi:hypothetical protein